jgi:hypothetical protein
MRHETNKATDDAPKTVPGECEYHNPKGELCGRPRQFYHLASGKQFCRNHYSLLSRVASGWVNLARNDARQAIEAFQAKAKPTGTAAAPPSKTRDTPATLAA